MAKKRAIDRGILLATYLMAAGFGAGFGATYGGWKLDRSPESDKYFRDARTIRDRMIKEGVAPPDAHQMAYWGVEQFKPEKLSPETRAMIREHMTFVKKHKTNMNVAMKGGAKTGAAMGLLGAAAIHAGIGAKRRRKEQRSTRRPR
ncbi:MAG: hypothetical protein JXB14_01095 [Candidatus Altiarchaeota archaeon]|nr:hypothetical protein [Candidatus Altiarchaeota archaeon]